MPTAYAVTWGAIGTERARRCISMISAAVVTRPAIADSEPVVRSTIATRSSSEGKGTRTLKMNRSSCASGRGYVPSISSGFWVARAKNGASSGYRWRATVTWCSCIASSRLDWVLGVARLISSARTRLANTGPGWNRNCRLPPSSMRMFVPVISAGMRSGVNWIRLKLQSMTSAIVRTSNVLPRPGTPSRSAWPLARRHVSAWRTRSRWPTMTRPTSASIVRARSANCSGESSCAAGALFVVIGAPPSLPGIERAEVVADVVLDRQRNVTSVQAGQRVLVEVAVDVLIGHDRAVVRALPGLVALLGLSVAAGAGDVARVARLAQAVERGVDAAQVGSQLGWLVALARAGEPALAADRAAQVARVRAAAADRALEPGAVLAALTLP